MAISMDLRVLARKLEKSSDDLLVSASTKGPETFEKVATAVAAASTLLESVADDMDQNAEFNITSEQLDEIAALASAFDESNDPLLKKQASVLDELLLSIAAPKNAATKSRKVTEDEINRLRAERRRARGEEAYVKPRQDHHDMWNAAQQAKAVEQQVKRYRPLEAPLQTRYPPDRPGGQMTRITDHVYQDIVTGVIYDFKAGYTTQKGNKVPGSSVENQTRQLGDYRNQSTSLFETRESLMGRYASNGDLHHLKKYAMGNEIAVALKAVRDLAPQMLDEAIDKAREDGLSTSEIGEILGDVASAEVTDMFRSVLEGADFDPTDVDRFKSEERMLSSEESEDSYRNAVQLLSTLTSAGWDSMVREMEQSGMRPEHMKALHETFMGGTMLNMEPARVSLVPEYGPHTEGLTMPARYSKERHSLVALALSAIQELAPHLLKAAVAKAKAEGLADTQIKYVLSSDFNTKFKEASFGEDGEIKAAESLLPHLKALGWNDLVKGHLKVMGSLGVSSKALRKLAKTYGRSVSKLSSYERLKSLFRYAGAEELELEEGDPIPLELEFDPYARQMNPLEPEEAGGLQTGEIIPPVAPPVAPSPKVMGPAQKGMKLHEWQAQMARTPAPVSTQPEEWLEGQSYAEIADIVAEIGHTNGFNAALEAIHSGGFDLDSVTEALTAEKYKSYGEYKHEGLISFLLYATDKQLWRDITESQIVEEVAQDFGQLWPDNKDEAFNLMKETILRAGDFEPAARLVEEQFSIAVGETNLLEEFKKWMASKLKKEKPSRRIVQPAIPTQVTPLDDLEEWMKTFKQVQDEMKKDPMLKTWTQMSTEGQRDKAVEEYRKKFNDLMNARGFVGAYEMKDGEFWKEIAFRPEAAPGGVSESKEEKPEVTESTGPKEPESTGPVTPLDDLEEWMKTFKQVQDEMKKDPMLKTWTQMSTEGQRDKAVEEYRKKFNDLMNARGFVGAYEMRSGRFWKDIANVWMEALDELPSEEVGKKKLQKPAKNSDFFTWEIYQKKFGVIVPQYFADRIDKEAIETFELMRSKLQTIHAQFKFRKPIAARALLKKTIIESRRFIISWEFEDAGLPLPWTDVNKVSIPKFTAELQTLGDLPEDLREERKIKELRKRIVGGDKIPGWYDPPKLKTFLDDQSGYLEARREAYKLYKDSKKERDNHMRKNGYAPLSHKLFGNKTIDSILRTADMITHQGQQLHGQTGGSGIIAKVPDGVVSIISDPKAYIIKYRDLLTKVKQKLPKRPWDNELQKMQTNVKEEVRRKIWSEAFKAVKNGEKDIELITVFIWELISDVFPDTDIPEGLIERIVKTVIQKKSDDEKLSGAMSKLMKENGFYDPNKAIIGTKTSAQLLEQPKGFRVPQSEKDIPLENPDIYED
jgi:hypothetical protein